MRSFRSLKDKLEDLGGIKENRTFLMPDDLALYVFCALRKELCVPVIRDTSSWVQDVIDVSVHRYIQYLYYSSV